MYQVLNIKWTKLESKGVEKIENENSIAKRVRNECKGMLVTVPVQIIAMHHIYVVWCDGAIDGQINYS